MKGAIRLRHKPRLKEFPVATAAFSRLSTVLRVLPLFFVCLLLACPQIRAASIEDLEESSIIISGDGGTVFYGDRLSYLARKNGSTSSVPGKVSASSQDGSVVLGHNGSSWAIFTGSAANGYSQQATLFVSGSSTFISGMNPSGTAVAGTLSAMGCTEAYLWIDDGATWTKTSLAGLSPEYEGRDVSNLTADGKWVVLGVDNRLNTGLVWFVDASDTSVQTGRFLDGQQPSPLAISADGTLAVGSSNDEHSNGQASIWDTGSGAITLLDQGTDKSSDVQGMNASGSVLVGYGKSLKTYQALYWTGSGTSYTLHILEQSLEEAGVNLDDWALNSATGVSDDGNIIVGTGSLSDSDVVYLANLGSGGLSTAESLAQSVASMAPVGRVVSNMGALSMSRLDGAAQGMGARFAVAVPGASAGKRADRASGLSGGDETPGSLELWGIGSLGTNNEMDGGDFGLDGGIGLTWHTGGQWRFGGGVFGDMRETDTDQTGSQRVEAIGPGVFVVYSPAGTGLEFGVSALWQSVDLRLTRGYVNGAGYATSTGSPNADVFGLTGRVQWTTRGFDESLALTPFAEYTWQSTHVEGYDESDGPFPASFNSRSDESNSIRTGLRLDADLLESMGTWAWAAVNHRFDSKSSPLGGTVTGLGRFNYDGADLDREWVDMGLGASWQLSERLSTNLTLSTALGCDDGTVPDLTASMGFSYTLW